MAKQLLIKDGKLQTNASGELLIIPDGDSASACECCDGDTTPCDEGTSCAHCDCLTPLTYTVTFQNIADCYPACFGGQHFKWSTGVDGEALMNAEFTLTQNTSCTWEFSGAGNNADWNVGSCTPMTDPPWDLFDGFYIVLTRDAGNWTLDMRINYGGTIEVGLFYDVQPEVADGNCYELPEFTNDQTSCNGTAWRGTGPDHATDGTATVVTCDVGVCCECDPDTLGATPENGTITVFADGSPSSHGCDEFNGTHPFAAFTPAASTSDKWCIWSWEQADSSSGFNLHFAVDGGTFSGNNISPQTINPGEWFIVVIGSGGGYASIFEKTTAFSCTSATGKVSGTHTFTAGAVLGSGVTGDECSTSTGTVTVPV